MLAHAIGHTLSRMMRYSAGTPPTLQPQLRQTATLRALLYRARHTVFGRKFGFQALLNLPDSAILDGYRQQVPLFNYEQMYQSWWYRVKAGETGVVWPEPIQYMANSSGTTLGSSKYVPVSPSMIRSAQRASRQFMGQLVPLGMPADALGRSVLSIGAIPQFKQEEAVLTGLFSGIVFGQTPSWIRPLFKPDSKAYHLEWAEKMDYMVREAPRWDLGAMYGFPVWITPLLEKIVQTHGLRTIRDIWPNLRGYAYAGMKIDPYWPRLAPVLGLDSPEDDPNHIMVLETYVASEGYFALQNRRERGTMLLLTRNDIYFEFIPFDGAHFDQQGDVLPNCRPLHWGALSVGVEYALLITNNSGAWRYLLGDTVVFESLEPPQIRFAGRTAHFLNECSEQISMGNLEMALLKAARERDFKFNDFTVLPRSDGNHFIHDWYIEATNLPPLLSHQLDQTLRQLNDCYDRARQKEALLAPEIIHLPPGTFQGWLTARGKADGQSKVPRVMKNKQAEQFRQYVTLM
jgi:GH3 auxin-responsive promoter